jgi:hypothetical protein
MIMPTLDKDLLIPKEFLVEFKNRLKVIDKKQWVGIWVKDLMVRRKVEEFLPAVRTNPAITQMYDLTLVYKGREMKFSNKYFGVAVQDKIIKKIPLIGIPVPWLLLKDVVEQAKINPAEWELMYTPHV